MTKKVLSRICECEICKRQALTEQTYLPDGWIVTWEYSYIICNKCCSRWSERFNEEPVHHSKGGEEELRLL